MIFYIKSCFIGWFTGQVIPKYSLVLTTYVEICPRYISTHNLGSTCHFFYFESLYFMVYHLSKGNDQTLSKIIV